MLGHQGHEKSTTMLGLNPPSESQAQAPPPRVCGSAIVYRLYDVGYGIDLERAAALSKDWVPARARPTRGEGQALQIPNPPLTLLLGPVAIEAAGAKHTG